MSDAGQLLARFARPRSDSRTRLAILSDLHLSVDEEGTWRVSHRTEDRLEATVRSLNDHDLDAVVFNGDLVQNGRVSEFDAFDRIIDSLEAPFLAVPGNHDLIERDGDPGSQLTLPEFEDRYAPGELPVRERIGGVDLIGLNSNSSTQSDLGTSYEGVLSTETLSWLDATLEKAETPLVAVHHTLDAVREQYVADREQLPIEIGGSPGFANAGDLSAILADHEVPLVVTSHLHFPAVAEGGPVREFTQPSLGPFPCGYVILDIDERGTTASFHSVGDLTDVIEALGYGLDKDRVLLAAARMAKLPILEDWTP